MKKTAIRPLTSALCLLTSALCFTGCTCMVGSNHVGHLAPRGSYRSVDSSGQDAEGLQEMQGGGQIESKVE